MMALRKNVILRRPRSGRLEGRHDAASQTAVPTPRSIGRLVRSTFRHRGVVEPHIGMAEHERGKRIRARRDAAAAKGK